MTRYPGFVNVRRLVRVGTGILLMMTAACGRQEGPAPPPPPPPAVVVSPVAAATVPLYREYVARTEARETVGIRSRVDGFLEKALFEEGRQVKAGQLLFVIDQRPFRAALQEARGSLAHAQASLNKARRDVARLQPLVAESAAPEVDLDNAESAVEFSLASIERAKAAIAIAELNLSQSEAVLIAANYRIGAARANFFPCIDEQQALVDSYRAYSVFAARRFKGGIESFLTVLDSERQLFSA